jgi:hypothetical protein
VTHGVNVWQYHKTSRASTTAHLANPANAQHLATVRNKFGSVQRFIDVESPLPPSWEFFRFVDGTLGGVRFAQVVAFMAWPWLTFVVLLIFIRSMKRARIRPEHVLRCTIYSGDIALWVAASLLIAPLARHSRSMANPFQISWFGLSHSDAMLAGMLAIVTVWLAASWRLWRAYQRYLRFDHAFAIVLVSQDIVGLALGLAFSEEIARIF